MDLSIFLALEKIDIISVDLETQEEFIYSSFIESISEKSMFISLPVHASEEMQFCVDEVITGRITTEDCAYFFEATLLASHQDVISLWEISLPLHLHRTQLREYVRVKINLEVQLEFLDEHFQRAAITTFTKDFSAGGLQVVLPVTPPASPKVVVILSLTDNKYLQVNGEFVRIKYPKTVAQKHFASIKFCDLDENLTNKIVKYIFDKQIERRQKERILFT